MTNIVQRNRAALAASLHPEAERSVGRALLRAGGGARHRPPHRLAGAEGRRRPHRQPRAGVRRAAGMCSPATTRSTSSTSTCRMARAGANRRSIIRATAPWSSICRGCKLGVSICYDIRFPQLYRALGACRGGGADRARRIHAPDRRGALARAAARARHREWRLRHFRRAGRPPCRRARDLRPFHHRRALGRGSGGSGRRGAGGDPCRDRPGALRRTPASASPRSRTSARSRCRMRAEPVALRSAS